MLEGVFIISLLMKFVVLALDHLGGIESLFLTKVSSETNPLVFEAYCFYKTTKYNLHSSYFTSKAGSYYFVCVYHDIYSMPTIVINSSNNNGTFQFLRNSYLFLSIAFFTANSLVGSKNQNVRDWLFIEDDTRVIDFFSQRYNCRNLQYSDFNEWNNIEIIKVLINTEDWLLECNKDKDLNLIGLYYKLICSSKYICFVPRSLYCISGNVFLSL